MNDTPKADDAPRDNGEGKHKPREVRVAKNALQPEVSPYRMFAAGGHTPVTNPASQQTYSQMKYTFTDATPAKAKDAG